jgi:hypothetical protein
MRVCFSNDFARSWSTCGSESSENIDTKCYLNVDQLEIESLLTELDLSDTQSSVDHLLPYDLQNSSTTARVFDHGGLSEAAVAAPILPSCLKTGGLHALLTQPTASPLDPNLRLERLLAPPATSSAANLRRQVRALQSLFREHIANERRLLSVNMNLRRRLNYLCLKQFVQKRYFLNKNCI